MIIDLVTDRRDKNKHISHFVSSYPQAAVKGTCVRNRNPGWQRNGGRLLLEHSEDITRRRCYHFSFNCIFFLQLTELLLKFTLRGGTSLSQAKVAVTAQCIFCSTVSFASFTVTAKDNDAFLDPIPLSFNNLEGTTSEVLSQRGWPPQSPLSSPR